MSMENKKTLEVYNETASIYLNSSIEHDNLDLEKAMRKRRKLEDLIKNSLSSIEVGSKVFEIGAADGNNCLYMKSLGYDVTAADIAPAFIEALKEKELNTIKFNVLEDDFKEKYAAIFCWRVFVHFTKEDASLAIKKVYDALEENGIFIFNAINRETREINEEWVDFSGEYHMGRKRFYSYFKQDDLDNMINDANFNIVDFHKEGGDENNKWLVYVLKK